MSALNKQVGGDHYKDCKIQPVEFIHANNLGFLEGNVVKYITRHRAKGGRADIEKVIHYAELILALEYPCPEATIPSTSSSTRKPPSRSKSERSETKLDTTLSEPAKSTKETVSMSTTPAHWPKGGPIPLRTGGCDLDMPTEAKAT